MREAALVTLLLVGCTTGTSVTPSSAPPAATATPSASVSSPRPTAPPSATPVLSTVYTADDEEIAKLIRAGADEAIPQLKRLNDMDPDGLEDQFLPLGDWITSQKAGLAAYTPSSCTTGAVVLFIRGIDQYDAIREQFLAWRDWGARGHAFPVGAPRQAGETFEEALVELDDRCPA